MKTFKLFMIICILTSAQLARSEVVIIAHPSVSEAASHKQIKKIFLGKRKSLKSGHRTIPISLPDGSPIREEFNKKVLKKSNSQLKSYWSKLMFTGKGQPPKTIKSEAEVVQLVKRNPNIIGYVNASALEEGVTVLGRY